MVDEMEEPARSMSEILRCAAGAGEIEMQITEYEEELLDSIAKAIEGLSYAEIMARLKR